MSETTNALDVPEALTRVDETALGAARARLADLAEASGELDVAYRTVDSPVGALLLAATPRGLVRVAFENREVDEELQLLADRVSPRILYAPARLDAVARELEDYFAGRRTAFEVPVDLALSRGFRRAVLDHLTTIGYGRTESYADIARTLDNPGAVRAVGSACGSNPVPIVVPCHRVLRSDGSLGGYAGGLLVKTALLRLEGALELE